jgi:hypothetical protein
MPWEGLSLRDRTYDAVDTAAWPKSSLRAESRGNVRTRAKLISTHLGPARTKISHPSIAHL